MIYQTENLPVYPSWKILRQTREHFKSQQWKSFDIHRAVHR